MQIGENPGSSNSWEFCFLLCWPRIHFRSDFPLQPSWESLDHGSKDVKDGLGGQAYVGEDGRGAKRARKHPDLSLRSKRESRKILSRGLGNQRKLLISAPGRRRPLRHKHQLEVVDNPVHHRIARNEGAELHSASAFGAEHRVDFANLADHARPKKADLHLTAGGQK